MNEERTGNCLRQGEHIRGHLWHSPFVFVTEPIQSRCAVLRYSKLTDQQVLKRLLEVCESEKVSYTDDGLEAIVFTAQGDMRQVTLIWFIVFNATFSNISAISWWPVWVVEEAGENHQTTDQWTIFHGENMLHFNEKWWWCPLYTRLCTCFLSWIFL